MMQACRILENGNLSTGVATFSEGDVNTLIQGLTLVVIEQQKIAIEAENIINAFKEANVTELEGIQLADIGVVFFNAKHVAQQCDNIHQQLLIAIGAEQNMFTIKLSNAAALMAMIKPRIIRKNNMTKEILDTDELDAARAEQARQQDELRIIHNSIRKLDYIKGWQRALHEVSEGLASLMDYDVSTASFEDDEEKTAASKKVQETVKWANKQDISDILAPTEMAVEQPVVLSDIESTEYSIKNQPDALKTAEFNALSPAQQDEKRILDLGSRSEGFEDIPQIEKATRQDFSGYSRQELELLLSENMQLLENLASTAKRDDMATDLWAEIANYFNDVMTGQLEEELDMPFMQRIFAFVDRLQTDSNRWNEYLNESFGIGKQGSDT